MKRWLLLGAALLAIVVASLTYSGLSYRILRRGVDEILIRRGVESLGRSVRIAPRDTPYDRWLAAARSEIPMFEGLVVDDIRTVALHPWPQMGEQVRGLYLRFADYQMTDGAVLEIPAGGATAPRRDLFEIGLYFFGGPGHTVLHQQDREPRTLAWNKGTLLSIPMNVRYQHVNGGGTDSHARGHQLSVRHERDEQRVLRDGQFVRVHRSI